MSAYNLRSRSDPVSYLPACRRESKKRVLDDFVVDEDDCPSSEISDGGVEIENFDLEDGDGEISPSPSEDSDRESSTSSESSSSEDDPFSKEYEDEVPKDEIWKTKLFAKWLAKKIDLRAMREAGSREGVDPDRTTPEPENLEREKLALDFWVRKLDKILTSTRKFLEETEPSMEKILEAKMSTKDRARAILLFDIYQNLANHTEPRLEARENLEKIIAEAKKRTEADLENDAFVEAEEVRLLASYQGTDSGYERNLKSKILALDTTDENKSKLFELWASISKNPEAETAAPTRTKLDLAIGLPFRKTAPSPFSMTVAPPKVLSKRRVCRRTGKARARVVDLEEPVETELSLRAKYLTQVRQTLDEELYGMEAVKDRLIELLNNRLSNPSSSATLALKGIPGTGKTAIVSALAKALNLPFERLCVGGMTDATVLKGSNGVWIGSEASFLLKFLKRSGVRNPILLFDELDKLSHSKGGAEVSASLLHITDYSQNSQFQDAYLSEFTHDLSSVWFMFALNDESKIDPVLRDRLTIVEVPAYTRKQLGEIVKKWLLPKALKECGLGFSDVTFSEDAADLLISKATGSVSAPTSESHGVRTVKRMVDGLISKINLLRVQGQVVLPFLIEVSTVEKYVESPKREKIPDMYS